MVKLENIKEKREYLKSNQRTFCKKNNYPGLIIVQTLDFLSIHDECKKVE